MSKTFDQGREEIAKLCRYFADNRQAFLTYIPKIDLLVYELNGLTEEETRIVESADS